MDYIEILKAVGKSILYVIWIWSMSSYFSKVVTHRRKNLCIKISDMETMDPFKCKRYYRIFGSSYAQYSSYEELTPIINKFPNLGLYVLKQIKVWEESDMIDLNETKISNYKTSKGSVDRFNL